jgi:hypothetical protein
MAGPHANSSPMSNLLHTLGITREDLIQKSDQMRQFLSAQDAISQPLFTQNNMGRHAATDLSGAAIRPAAVAPTAEHEPLMPIKDEPAEDAVPLTSHTFEKMEIVMERKARQSRREKKNRKELARERMPAGSSSPSQSRGGFSLDSFMHSRGSRRVSVPEASTSTRPAPPVVSLTSFFAPSFPSRVVGSSRFQVPAVSAHVSAPFTPQHLKYYRDWDSVDRSQHRSQKVRCVANADCTLPDPFQNTYYNRDESPSTRGGGAQPVVNNSDHMIPPRNPWFISPPRNPSPRRSSPQSSPVRRVCDVSSPGPMGPAPDEKEYDKLPFTLPPGPYSEIKPDLCYAAMVGRAILSSPQHMLTLQEIYEWITIVFPHFKRHEATWQNSIRHVLSTTACFRKVTRKRQTGRTLWAIWDQDLMCFEHGGFNKQYCSDMNLGKPSKKRPASGQADTGSLDKGAKALKRARTNVPAPEPSASGLVKTISLPIFPSTCSGPQHQPYHESCFSQFVPSEISFPAVPSYLRLPSVSASSEASSIVSSGSTSRLSAGSEAPSDSPAPSETSFFSVSIPDLTPSRSSSSPPSEEVLNSEPTAGDRHGGEDFGGDDDVFGDLSLRYPDEPSSPLLGNLRNSVSKDDQTLEPYLVRDLAWVRRSDRFADKVRQKQFLLSPIPPSPTPMHRSLARNSVPPPRSPSPSARPCTPPLQQHTNATNLSLQRTPMSHRGLHMSPSTSLAHYKSNLDPPPAVPMPSLFNFPREDATDPKTPPRKSTRVANHTTPAGAKTTANPFCALTPRRLMFTGDSPFRTPGSALRSQLFVYDPHDPTALLDEELSRWGRQDSPAAGLFPRGNGYLYESPTAPSPSTLAKWW